MTTWLQRSAESDRIQSDLQQLIQLGYFSDNNPWVLIHDMVKLKARFQELTAAFPPSAIHSVAVKANPLLEILRFAVKAGLGLEVASAGEIALAKAAGCPNHMIVFDSPAKTMSEIGQACSEGILLNANSELELHRIHQVYQQGPVGLRINPVVASDDRESTTMVATRRSKFGVPVESARALLTTYNQVSGLHLHVGSQVATAQDLVRAASIVVELAREFPQIRWIDIGGGLPTRYNPDDPGLTPSDYSAALQKAVPRLFEYQLYTEVGRAIQANCGYAVSRVEYVQDGRLILHFGADFALRECYQPEKWPHTIEVFTSNGQPKDGPQKKYDIFGPLCFSGDRLAHELSLPEVEVGDLVVMHDCGGYALSMWSRYCSRAMPEVLGWNGSDFELLRKRESPEDLVRFWSKELEV